MSKYSKLLFYVFSVLTKFYKKNKDEDVSATFIVCGKAYGRVFKRRQAQPSEVAGSEEKDKIVYKSVICKEDKLEATKESFVEVLGVNIYSLQKGVLENLRRPLNTNYAGKSLKDYKNVEERLSIVCGDVVDNLKEINEKRKAFDMSSIDLPALAAKVKRGPKVFIKKIVVKKDQHSLQAAFANAKNDEVRIFVLL